MKKLIALSLMLVCQFAFANPLPKEEGQLVIRAIQDSLNTNNLKCSYANQTLNASELNWAWFSEDGEVSIYEGEQPVITIKTFQKQYKKEVVLDISTNADFTQVTKISGDEAEIITAVTNVGTIIRPRYEETTFRKVLYTVDCK